MIAPTIPMIKYVSALVAAWRILHDLSVDPDKISARSLDLRYKYSWSSGGDREIRHLIHPWFFDQKLFDENVTSDDRKHAGQMLDYFRDETIMRKLSGYSSDHCWNEMSSVLFDSDDIIVPVYIDKLRATYDLPKRYYSEFGKSKQDEMLSRIDGEGEFVGTAGVRLNISGSLIWISAGSATNMVGILSDNNQLIQFYATSDTRVMSGTNNIGERMDIVGNVTAHDIMSFYNGSETQCINFTLLSRIICAEKSFGKVIFPVAKPR
jgi:hypothetical protein